MTVDIAAENARTTGREHHTLTAIMRAGDLTNVGFTRSISVNVGEKVRFSVDGGATVIDIYRIGYYGGDGWRKVGTITNTPANQPEAQVIPGSNGATTCTAWSITAEWDVPADATSGLYVGLVRTPVGDPGYPNGSYIPFVVRDDDAEADIIYKTSDSTWGAAYNYYGTPSSPTSGKNVYGQNTAVGNINDRSFAVSYHRPNITRETCAQTYWQACEQPLIRWLERMGFSIKYVTCVDLDRDPSILEKGSIFLSAGHDEYWTTPMRDAVENWRDRHAGRSIFMSGNEVFWRARYTHDGGAGDETVMWCYKDTMPGPNGVDHTPGQPLDPVMWTGTWKDTRWPGNRPEWLLTGTDFRMNGVNDYDATIPANPYGGLKVWGGSSLNDAALTLTRVIGFEADSKRPTQPEGAYRILAAYTRAIPGAWADDNGQNYTLSGDLEWGIVAQRYDGGGATIGFGTCQWGWTLDGVHDRGSGTEVSLAAQQFTTNLLRALGAEPATPHTGISLAVAIPTLGELAGYPPSGPEDSLLLVRTQDGQLLVVRDRSGDALQFTIPADA